MLRRVPKCCGGFLLDSKLKHAAVRIRSLDLRMKMEPEDEDRREFGSGFEGLDPKCGYELHLVCCKEGEPSWAVYLQKVKEGRWPGGRKETN
ncbi:unnamed protein product [Victoria cruziana]